MSFRWVAALLAATSLLAACRTTADVAVEVSEDGSGTLSVTVVLDPDAAGAVGGVDGIVLSDLEGSTWNLTAPAAADDGSVTVAATHGFSDGEDLAGLLDSVAGPGVFDGVHVEVDESFGSTEWSAGMEVAVSGDPAQFSDEALTALLGGLPLGRTPEELAEVGATGEGAATLTVELSMFGEDTDSATLDLASGEPATAVLEVAHRETRWVVYALVGVAGVSLLLAVVFGAMALRRRSRSQGRIS